jgi:hypothetical protein
MKDGNDKDEGQSGSLKKNPRQNPRQDRLKLALRENLKRRKSQARGRDDFALAPSNANDVTPHDDGDEVPGE